MYGKQTTYKVLAVMPFMYVGGRHANKAVVGPFDHYRTASTWALNFEKVAKEMGKEATAVIFPENDHKGATFVFHSEFATMYDSEVKPEEMLTKTEQFVQMLKKQPLFM